MKKTILALAAFVALSGTAFAAGADTRMPAPAATCVETTAKVKLDCASTGSIVTPRPVADNGSAETKGPRLGIDINPWIMPSTF